MELDNNQAESRLAPLQKVTPLSKYLAMLLFVLTPFIGGWIGYKYAPYKIVEVQEIVNDSDSSLLFESNIDSEEKNLSRDQDLLNEYKTATGGLTYNTSSTSIRTLASLEPPYSSGNFLGSLQEFTDLDIDEEIMDVTKLPYLSVLASTSKKYILTRNCFVATECGNSNLYELDLINKTLSEMKISPLYDNIFYGSTLSPDKQSVISEIGHYNDGEEFISSNLHVLDLFNDSHIVLDTILTGEPKTFCELGVGCDLRIKWLSSKKFELQISNYKDFDYSNPIYTTRVYDFSG